MVRSDTYVTDTLDETVFRELQNHRTVLLFYTYGAEQNRWQFPGAIERFKPCIWDRGSNLGGIVRNPMLQNALATDRFFNLNLQPILENGSKVNLDHFPCTAEMHVLGIDKPARDRLQSLVYGNKKFIDDDTLRRLSVSVTRNVRTSDCLHIPRYGHGQSCNVEFAFRTVGPY